ncbi:adenylyltransferase and sulfurtransferase [Mesonia phycicola]|uniref:Molybdopterin-synthase adenylyltransferase n=1 Tax=Mesonia phycicola TaxID=579105 RepID=A0A1M6ECH3_9FLAO|nr:HesA/MoeB/ThiF family protein [Mesonia phycicola]SHI83010.1 adenylyltransferase and sulfurtransferase [Mesonia phycicola]
MLTSEEKKRYSRHLILEEFGEEKQQKLKKARVLVIGAGGLSCPALQYLAAAGVGTLAIIDNDKVDQSNLQRQILYTQKDIGSYKVVAAKKRLQAMNPLIDVVIYKENLTVNNAIEIFENYDLIIEGSDSFAAKYLTNDAAVLTKKPFVLASISKFEGQLSVFNYQDGPTYRCLFPEPASLEMPTCSQIGVLGVLPGVLGTLMANEAIKMLTGLEEVLSGKLLTLNLLSLEQQIFPFQKDVSIQITQLEELVDSCSTQIAEISYQEYVQQLENYALLDVRTLEERKKHHIGGKHIPLDQLEKSSEKISAEKTIVYCASGVRSKKAIEILQRKFSNQQFLNLKGGL